ncbi:MAG: AraC family transcriptional regulator [Endozoicomonas sp.]|uniref:AraC family transcriptional regulator n=1 Tax=Endozoicomonas sp. TaxID=1892382 RepID=UPI003D9AE353
MNQSQLLKLRQPRTLIENRVSFAGPDSELSIYDTYQSAERVRLKADQLLHCGMIRGKKIMHARQQSSLFLPHESFLISPGKTVEIDFPDASVSAPTTCLTIEVSKERVYQIADRLSDISGQYDQPLKSGSDICCLHTHHTAETQQLIERMVHTFTENHPDRDLLIDLKITELVVRFLRHQGRKVLLDYCYSEPDASGLNAAINLIENNLERPLDIECLCQTACMSRSRLYKAFKSKIGVAPAEYQKQRRMEKALLMLGKGLSVTQICFELGFQNLSHFSRIFRQFYGVSPSRYLSGKIINQ